MLRPGPRGACYQEKGRSLHRFGYRRAPAHRRCYQEKAEAPLGTPARPHSLPAIV
jgi:hypothetical protein